MKKKTEELLWSLSKPIVESHGVSLYDVEYVKEDREWYLRIYIDSPLGIDLEKCQEVSRTLSDMLDEKDPIEESYYLEVSSPGIDRLIRRPEHFEGALGETVEMKLKESAGGKKKIVGPLEGFDDETVTVGGTLYRKDNIKEIRVYVEF